MSRIMQILNLTIMKKVIQCPYKTSEKTSTPKNSSIALTQRPCYANKCCLLRVKGILRRPIFCTNNKNMCLGCINENLRHHKVIQIEKDILNDYSFNETLAPIISYFTIPTDLKRIRKLLSHLPAYKNNKRDDHIYGATRYVANSLGILLNDANANSSINSPMMTVEKKQAWRVATFHCRCDYDTTMQKRFNIRTFCTVCSCLVFQHDKPSITSCPGCTRNDSWETIGLPCLAC